RVRRGLRVPGSDVGRRVADWTVRPPRRVRPTLVRPVRFGYALPVSGVSRFVSDSILTFLLAIFNRGLGILAGIVLARYLGPVGKGYIAYAPIGLELFATAMNGLALAVTFQYGRNHVPGGAVHRAMLRIVAAASLPSAIALAAVAWWIPSQHVLLASAV